VRKAPRTLFDSPSASDPTEEELAAPVPAVEAVLFDFSNTLFHIIDLPEWLRRVATASGRAAPDPVDTVIAELGAAYGRPEVLALQAGRDTAAHLHRAAMCAWFAEVDFLRGAEDLAYDLMKADDAWLPYPDTGPVLRALAGRGIPVGVVSDIGWDLRAHFAYHGLADLVGAVALSCEVGREKPDPLIFLKACSDLGVDPRRTLMVGDSPARDGGAVAVGMRAFILPAEHRTGERGLDQVLRMVD
jgi:HAD superfamily hydrolase (TIGR01509 family)